MTTKPLLHRHEFYSAPYSLAAGRCIVFKGTPLCTLHKIGSDATGYTMNAADMDDFAALVVRALNNQGGPAPEVSDRAPRVTEIWRLT